MNIWLRRELNEALKEAQALENEPLSKRLDNVYWQVRQGGLHEPRSWRQSVVGYSAGFSAFGFVVATVDLLLTGDPRAAWLGAAALVLVIVCGLALR
jgi:hypothetical protein